MDVAQEAIDGNPVGALQELCATRGIAHPTYDAGLMSGPPHDPSFTVTCAVGTLTEDGQGKTKKQAKKQAAQKVLLKLRHGQQQHEHEEQQQPTVDEEQPQQQQQPVFDIKMSGVESSFQRMRLGLLNRDQTKLLWLHSQEAAPNLLAEAASVLETIGKEQCFDVTFVDVEERCSTGGQFKSMVQLGTCPVVVCCGKGNSEEEARNEAALTALEYLRYVTKPESKEQTSQDSD